jgi:hypothetical protein
VRPVFLSEAYYERQEDSLQIYHTRWQPWTALLNGSCGYGYGAWGMWQFYDKDNKYGETGKVVGNRLAIPWQEALMFEGSNQIQHVSYFFNSIEWWKLRPGRNKLKVNNLPNKDPGDKDFSPPHLAFIPGELYVVYIPKGNSDNLIELEIEKNQQYSLKWYNPISGHEIVLKGRFIKELFYAIPKLPKPEQDWVFVIQKTIK